MEQKSFIFIKDYNTRFGKIKKNSELRIFRGFFYLDGGMIMPSYSDVFEKLIINDNLRNEYLSEKKIIENKI